MFRSESTLNIPKQFLTVSPHIVLGFLKQDGSFELFKTAKIQGSLIKEDEENDQTNSQEELKTVILDEKDVFIHIQLHLRFDLNAKSWDILYLEVSELFS